MPEYEVLVPIAGYALVTVEAEDEKAAIDAAMQKELTIDDIETWEAYEYICEGNVCLVDENSAYVVECIGEED